MAAERAERRAAPSGARNSQVGSYIQRKCARNGRQAAGLKGLFSPTASRALTQEESVTRGSGARRTRARHDAPAAATPAIAPAAGEDDWFARGANAAATDSEVLLFALLMLARGQVIRVG